MEVIGTLKVKFDTQEVSDRFKKREFILTTEANTPYPQHVSFQVTQDKCSVLDGVNEGDEIKVQFNLRGREWNGPQGIKYFNTLEAWRIEHLKSGNGTAQTAPVSTPPQSTDNNDDLPF